MDALVNGLMEELNCETVFTIPLFGGIPIYESVVVTWIIMAVLAVIFFLLGRNLSMYDNVDFNIDNSAKIEELKVKIQNGTYNVDAKLTAQSILNNIKEGR